MRGKKDQEANVAKLKDLDVSQYLKDCVDMVPEQINEEFARMSADYAYWNEKYAEANRVELVREWEVSKSYASLYLQKKFDLEAAGKKAPEASVDAEVKTSQVYGAAMEAHIEAQAERETKREMLVSAGAHLRQEMQGDPIMRDKAMLARLERESRG
jgi:hypothetical protein